MGTQWHTAIHRQRLEGCGHEPRTAWGHPSWKCTGESLSLNPSPSHTPLFSRQILSRVWREYHPVSDSRLLLSRAEDTFLFLVFSFLSLSLPFFFFSFGQGIMQPRVVWVPHVTQVGLQLVIPCFSIGGVGMTGYPFSYFKAPSLCLICYNNHREQSAL